MTTKGTVHVFDREGNQSTRRTPTQTQGEVFTERPSPPWELNPGHSCCGMTALTTTPPQHWIFTCKRFPTPNT